MIVAETPRLRLRHFTPEDAPEMALVLGDPEVMRYSLKGAMSVAQVRGFLEDIITTYVRKGFGLWAVEEIATGRVIGYCGHYFLTIDGQDEVELGYRLARASWGKGLAAEAAKAALHYAFTTLKLPRLIAVIEPENRASIGVAEKCGLIYQKTTAFHNRAVKIYALEARDYQG